jgi:O-antigen/teichoic acid export membrane protein
MAKSVSARIFHNSFWYGIETVIETIVFLGGSILIARYLGPAKLGYYSYINFFVITVTRTGGSGLAGATRKYMSEFLALDRIGEARAVYHFAFRYQLLGSVAITILSLAGVWLFGEPEFRITATILILCIVPGVMSWVPAQANSAFEDVSKNTLSAFGYLIAYAVMILLTLHFKWDLVGVAGAQLLGRVVEVLLRATSLHRRLRVLPLGELDQSIKHAIRRFCLEAVGIQLLMSVVWDRSELVFLRAFSSLEQIAFYSVSFGLANNLLLIPRTFGSATGITLMVETTRDPKRVAPIVKSAARYLLLVVFPVHLGAAAIAARAVSIFYGAKYIGAIPVLIIASILSIPRAFQEIPEVLFRAADRQQRLLFWFAVTGVFNIALDALLIPRFGAVGAAWGNGLAQSLGIVLIWQQARRFYDFRFPVGSALRLLTAGSITAALAWLVVRMLPGLHGLIVAVLAATLSYMLLVKLLGGLDVSDRQRLGPIAARLPGPAARVVAALIGFMTPAPATMD